MLLWRRVLSPVVKLRCHSECDEPAADKGHPGIKRILYFMRYIDPSAAKADIKQVIKNWDMLVDWPSTSTMVKRTTGSKWCMAKGGNGYHLLSWQPLSYLHRLWIHLFCDLVTTGMARVLRQLLFVFYERSAPEEILADIDIAFCNQQVWQFLHDWRIRHVCAIR